MRVLICGLGSRRSMQQPRTSYARNGDVSIAYQVVGDGPVDLVFVPGYISHLDLWWSIPETAAFYGRLASFSRLILFDKRGTGLSDPVPGVPTLEERMQDLHAVLNAAGCERAALFGISEGGPMSVLHAATYPERTKALVLYGSAPRFAVSDRFLPEKAEFFDRVRRETDAITADWGAGRSLELFAPTWSGDEARRRGLALFERASASPAMVTALFKAWWEVDVTAALEVVSAPTLVLHRTGDRVLPVEAGRYMADRIPGARFVELPGDDHFPTVGDSDSLLDEVEQFLTGARHTREPDRILATILFTDIVASTQRAAELGDRGWRELLHAHETRVRERVGVYGGRLVKTLGDGYLATFDGPARATRCARAIVDEAGSLGIEVRAGLHTGECELLSDDIAGMAVHIAARVAAKASAGEVLVSGVVRDIVVGSGIEFAARGTHELKGVPGAWTLLAVLGTAPQREPWSRPPEPRDQLAPNLANARPGDRSLLRIARSAPSVGRALSRVAMRRSKV